jgi:hypothetical protein
MGFSCPSRNSRPAGISSMALSPAGAAMLGVTCKLQQTAWDWHLACVYVAHLQLPLCLLLICAPATCCQVHICIWS